VQLHFKQIIVNKTHHRALSGAEAHINATPFKQIIVVKRNPWAA